MSTITLELPPETERRLRDRADASGQSVESLVRDLVVAAAEPEPRKPRYMTEPQLTREQFQKLVKKIADSVPGTALPRDFTREELYPDED